VTSSSMTHESHPPPARIVVRGTNWVGDTVISLPAAKEIRRILPYARISFWVPASTAPLLQASGITDEIISFPVNSGGPIVRPFRMKARLASEKFDMAVLFQNAFESAFTALLAGIPLRLGYPTDLRGPLLNLRVPRSKDIRGRHQVYYYLAITDFLEAYLRGGGSSRKALPDCSIKISEEKIINAKEVLLSMGVDFDLPLFCLCPGSANSEAKRWPADSFARLADLLIDRMGGQVVFVGAPHEASIICDITSMMCRTGSVNFAGKADMITSMAVMTLSRAVISNDTGSAHLAVAASSTVLTIFGPTSPGQTAPFGPSAHIIQGSAPCAPCRHFRCPMPDHPCMRSVDPEAVFNRVQEILSPR